jgi:pimeloyl-ACP methyl ester carboxylesterase
MLKNHFGFLTSDGLKLAATAMGKEDRAPILFLHGLGQTRQAWDLTMGIVARSGWRTYSIDLRGHGESEWDPKGDYTIDPLCRDCIEFVESLPATPVIVGASLGGIISLLNEASITKGFSRGLILVDVTPQMNQLGVERIKNFMRSGLDGFSSLEEAAAAIAQYIPSRKPSLNTNGLRKVLREKNGRWYWHWDPLLLSDTRNHEVDVDIPKKLEGALEKVDVPVMLVRGLLSDVVDDSSVADFIKRKPSAKLINIPDASHMIAGDKNDVFTASVMEFLNQFKIDPSHTL